MSDRTYILMTEQYGRGVYANRPIKSGELIEMAETLVLNEQDTWSANQTGLKDYTFVVEEDLDYTFSGNRDCLVLGDGELYNHSDQPNASYRLINLNGRMQMEFRAIKDIMTDEQIFIDYNADTKRQVNVGEEKYTTNLV